MNIGYARVSTCGQNLESQLEQLGKAACSKIYREKISGAGSDRPELQRLLRALESGSVVVVTRLGSTGSLNHRSPDNHQGNCRQKLHL
jgi:DNA invertase Pin-like site-specific DNA recombinase